MSGGRYDNLMSGFLKDSGAIGFAVNVDAATKALINERGETSKVDIIVFCNDGFEIESFEHIKALSTGHIVEFSLFDSLEETIEYAKAKSISRVDFIGDSVEIIEI